MLFSVIIPTYNRASYLMKTISSVLDQTYQNLELIIVDDGSTDCSASLVKSLTDPRVKYLYQRNSERGCARNLGIKYSKGYYIQFVDSDDILSSHHLQQLFETVINYNTPDVIAGTSSQQLPPEVFQYKSSLSNDISFIHNRVLLLGNPFSCNFAIKRTSVRHLFNTRRDLATMEDWIFLIQNLLPDRSLLLMHNPTVKVGVHLNQSMCNHVRVINARQNALSYILSLDLIDFRGQKSLRANNALFIAIHYRLDSKYVSCIHKLFLINPLLLDNFSRFKVIYTFCRAILSLIRINVL